MIKFEIIEVNDYIYTLKNNNNIFNFTIEFYGLDKTPTVNDYIFLHENMINNTVVYSFGLLSDTTGKDINNLNEEDIIELIMDNKHIYLKRLYG